MQKKLLLMYSTHKPSQQHISLIEEYLGLGSVSVANSEEQAILAAADAEIIFGHRYLQQVMPYVKCLKWVQSTAGGMDRLPLDEIAAHKARLSRSTLGSKTIARHAYTLMWALIRGLHQVFQNQMIRRYDAEITILPEPKNVLILGTGAIGCAFAQMLQGDNVQVWGVNQSGVFPEYFDEIYTGNSWHSVLSNVDVIVLALPASINTKMIVDELVLSLLPSHAVLINVGRAETLDTRGLCEALHQGKLGGAGLDVIANDYRSEDSIIWTTPNLIITPHNAAHCAERKTLLEDFCIEQLVCYLKGQHLLNEVVL